MRFNIHTHSEHSHDAAVTIDALCERAIAENLSGFAVTDHCDCEYAADPLTFTRLLDSCDDTLRARARYGDRLVIAAGVEIGEALYDRDFARKVIAARPWDVVLGSVHAVRWPGWEIPFSMIDFSGCDDAFLQAYLRRYYDDLREMAETEDYDVLCHLTVPLRYLCGKFGRRVETAVYDGQIDGILRVVIERGKTLEVNTSGCTAERPYFMPDEAILDRDLAMGGRSLAVGSDAHTAERLTNGLAQAEAMLRKKGVTELTYYLRRQPVVYRI